MTSINLTEEEISLLLVSIHTELIFAIEGKSDKDNSIDRIIYYEKREKSLNDLRNKIFEEKEKNKNENN